MLILTAMSTSKPAGAGPRKALKAAAADARGVRAGRNFSGTRRKTTSRDTQDRLSGASRHTHRGLLGMTTDTTVAALTARYGARLRALAVRMNDPKASLDVNDLVQVGLLGLIEAWHVFDPDENDDFWLYAYARVHGAMVDELRAMRHFSRRIGREFHMETYVPDIHDVPVQPASVENLRSWASYLDDLPHRERQVVGLYIVRELALHRIGKLYDVSESRVAQIVNKALKTLRGNMQ